MLSVLKYTDSNYAFPVITPFVLFFLLQFSVRKDNFYCVCDPLNFLLAFVKIP